MKTLLYVVREDNTPELLAEAVEPDLPIFEGSIVSIEEDGEKRPQLYEVFSEIWSIKTWSKKAEATRNLYLAKSLIREDNKLKGVIIHGSTIISETDKNVDK